MTSWELPSIVGFLLELKKGSGKENCLKTVFGPQASHSLSIHFWSSLLHHLKTDCCMLCLTNDLFLLFLFMGFLKQVLPVYIWAEKFC